MYDRQVPAKQQTAQYTPRCAILINDLEYEPEYHACHVLPFICYPFESELTRGRRDLGARCPY